MAASEEKESMCLELYPSACAAESGLTWRNEFLDFGLQSEGLAVNHVTGMTLESLDVAWAQAKIV